MAPPKTAPSSILIVGSGVFGMSTAYALSQRPAYQNTKITVLDRSTFPAPDASSIDSSRIVRADYSDYHYSALCMETMPHWRSSWGAEGRYHQPGLAIVCNDSGDGNGGERAEMQKEMQRNLQRLGLTLGSKESGGDVQILEDEAAVKAVAPSLGGAAGGSGYVNWTSGWADAEAGMRYLYSLVTATGRVDFRTAEVERLLFDHDSSSVAGVQLTDGERVEADLTILATGAWTPNFIDLRGIASASGQVLAYVDISPEEQAQLGNNPTMLSVSTGMFLIPPRSNVLKVARHGYGYANFVKIPHPEREGEEIEVSLPRTKTDDPNLNIPREGDEACRAFLTKCLPHMADRPWTHTRICWYTDTPNGDWLIDYHPRFKNLFVATGGAGHAYKFVPVVGHRIVDVIENRPRDDLGEKLQEKWSWPKEKYHSEHIWTDDWRGGRKGMVLDEELRK